MIRTLSSLLVAGLILSSGTRVSGDAVLRSAGSGQWEQVKQAAQRQAG